MTRARGYAVINRRKTHCPQGHAYTPANTRTHDGKRQCIICNNALSNRRRREATQSLPNVRLVRDGLSRIRIPVEPLLLHIERRQLKPSDFHPSVRRTLERCRASGSISMGYADEVCGLLKIHPAEIWGPDWFAYGEEAAS